MMVLNAYSIVKDKEVAKDMVAKVFEKVLLIHTDERTDRFDGSFAYFKNTVNLVLRNLCLDYIKLESNRKEILKNRFWLNPNMAKNGAEDIFVADAFTNLKQHFGKQQCTILELHLEGYKNDEIAEKLNISYNTVRNTLTNVRKKAKKLWEYFF